MRVWRKAILSLILYIIVSLVTKPDAERAKYTWSGLGLFDVATQRRFVGRILALAALCAVLAVLMVKGTLAPVVCAWIAAIAIFVWFLEMALRSVKASGGSLIKEDRLWAGLLAGCAMFMMFFFY